ncbi:hypothetical protein LB542_20200 [Mesorhizobium sp. BR1-1-9]|uniref:hypothetical protein n=1 Tax=unclassified Mesorhizobium TaxID=325217 RepID=UPI001CD0FE97|nr:MULTISPECIES: hypothetical protein [unclassified Mesorhizobium]MBZ9873173.1 hypothetical protein [Mesorhizobium sp. BR1-1-9]MBZ9945016.1 hypothetical protein [Mesorhizobium sp. BR1-1-13]
MGVWGLLGISGVAERAGGACPSGIRHSAGVVATLLSSAPASAAKPIPVSVVGLSVVMFVHHASATEGAGGDDYGHNSLSYGGADTYGESSIAVGGFAKTGRDDTPSNNDTAVGEDANAFGQSLAVGSQTKAGFANQIEPNLYRTAIGPVAEAGQGANGLVLSTPVGCLAKTKASYATALSSNTATNLDNQVAIGNGGNTYTLAGVNSQASKDAQGAATYPMTTDGDGNLAASIFDVVTLDKNLPAQLAQSGTDITNLSTTVNNHTTQVPPQASVEGVLGSAVAEEGRIDCLHMRAGPEALHL